MKNGIEPNLINKLDDLGIKPSDFDRLNISNIKAAKVMADTVGSVKIVSHFDDIAKVADLNYVDDAAKE